MYARPTAPLSIGGVLDDGIRLYGSSLRYCWGFGLAYGVATAIAQIVVLLSIWRELPGRQTPAALMSRMATGQMFGVMVLTYILIALASLIFYGAILARQSAVARGDETYTAGRALAAGFRRLPAMLLGSFLFGIMLVLSFFILMLPASLAAGRAAVWFSPLLAIPAIYLWGRLGLWFAPLFAENAGAIAALETSWRLTKGNWWRATIILTVAVIMMIVLYIAVAALAGAIAVLGPGGVLGQQITLRVLSAVLSIFLVPLGPAMWLAMYHDFKLRREGGDLEARAGALNRAA